MSLSEAHKSIALICEVLELPLTYLEGDLRWCTQVGDCPLELRYCPQVDELQISHQLAAFGKGGLTAADIEINARFSESYLKRKAHWIECDVGSGTAVLYHRMSLADGNECTLCIQVPRFVQLCCSWRAFFKRAKKGIAGRDDDRRPLARSSPQVTLALCEKQEH